MNKLDNLYRNACALWEYNQSFFPYRSEGIYQRTLPDIEIDTIVVQQRHYAILTQDDKASALATGNLTNCVGVAIFNPKQEKVCLAHIDAENLMEQRAIFHGVSSASYGPLEIILNDIAPTQDEKTALSITLVGGFSPHIFNCDRIFYELGAPKTKVYFAPEWACYGGKGFDEKGAIGICKKTGYVYDYLEGDILRDRTLGTPPSKVPQPVVKQNIY